MDTGLVADLAGNDVQHPDRRAGGDSQEEKQARGRGVKHARLIEKAAAEHLGFIEKIAQDAGVACKSVQVTSDFPADAIVAAAQRNKCDLIFMASHGHGGLTGLLLGSQTQKVMLQSKVPVLLDR